MTRAAIVRRRPQNPALNSDPYLRGFQRFFDEDLFRPASLLARYSGENLSTSEWMPPVDVHESEEAFLFTAELPGLTKEDVAITLEDNILTLSGERTFEEVGKDDAYRRIERSYGSFTRSFTLPHQVDQDKVEAKFKDGVLTISVGKAEESKPRKIVIK